MLHRLFSPVVVLAVASLCSAQTGEPVLPPDPAKLSMSGSGVGKTSSKIVDASGPGFAKAWRVQVKEKVGGDSNVQLVAAVEGLQKGDVVLMSVYARMISSADESGEGRVTLVLEQAKETYAKTFSASFGVSKEWRRYDVPAVVTQDFSKTGAHVTIRLGQFVQTVEIGGVELRKMPAGTRLSDLPRTSITYPGREESAPWRAEAAKRIEQVRKADLAVTVTDAAGAPVPNATVEIKETRGAFPFGSCYASARFTPDATGADSVKYREVFLQNFDTGVDEYTMKWPGWVVPETREKGLAALKWMDEHDVRVRGHCLVWPGWRHLPPDVKNLAGDPAALEKAIHDHITSEVTDLRGRVIDWDVVNEPNLNYDLLKIFGEPVMAQWFRWAREADPAPHLYLNETNVPTAPPNDDHYTRLFDRAKLIKDSGGPIYGVGMQAHFGMNVVSPTDLIKIFDRFQTLGMPVRITEFDLDMNDEDLQAAYFRDFLTICFSHPEVDGFLMWGFWEGAHWRPNAALYRKDWSERKIAGIWRDLTLKQWRTNAVGTTGASGKYAARAFLGEYDVTVKANGKTETKHVTLAKDASPVQITF